MIHPPFFVNRKYLVKSILIGKNMNTFVKS